LYYEKRIKQMPVKVLKKHGIIDYEKNLITLNTGKLTLQQQAELRMLCEQKLQEFVTKRGLSIWDYRLFDSDPVTDNLRYEVLKASGGRCELCGASKKEHPLHVDHIIPRNKKGKTEIENLQVLCDKCNCTKRDKDTTDFRDNLVPDSIPDCLFCYEQIKDRIIEKNNSVVAIFDEYPVSKNHTLIIPIRHTLDYFSMTSNERSDSERLLRVLQKQIQTKDTAVTGFNVGMNCGVSAGQTISHAHIHLIPRRDSDTPEPRGGVRGVIPSKMSY
jgi:diadenosine tetraphosphate (Ap4A) HIT family hydrolase